MTNLLLLSSFILGAMYLLGSGGDPVPEITWSTFYREMLTKGEVFTFIFNVGSKGSLLHLLFMTKHTRNYAYKYKKSCIYNHRC